jgi:hypothetical protein
LKKEITKPDPDSPAADAATAQPQDALTEIERELFFREILPSATVAGMVVRQTCLEVLGQLDRQDGAADLAALISDKHLEPGATEAFLRIGPELLTKLRVEPKTADQAPPQQVEARTAPPTSNLLAETERLSRVVAEAQERRQRLPELQREAAELEAAIASSQERLAVIKPQLEEIEGFLTNPEIDAAEQTLTTLRKLLSQ